MLLIHACRTPYPFNLRHTCSHVLHSYDDNSISLTQSVINLLQNSGCWSALCIANRASRPSPSRLYTHLCIFSDMSNFTPESVSTPRESSTACRQHTWQQKWRSEARTAPYDGFLESSICISKKKKHPLHVCHFPALWAYFWKANLPRAGGRNYCREAHFEPYTHLFFTVFPVPHFSVDQSTSSKTTEKCYGENCTHEGIFRESPLEEKVK